MRGGRVGDLRRTYAEGRASGPRGGSGFLEIALPGGSAAAEIGADIGEPVTARG
jgi:hypothetical protein